MNKCQFVPLAKWPKLNLGPYQFVIADSPCLKKQGMQWTKGLPTNTLMIFPQMSPGMWFHTKNCIPLDIVPMSSHGELLNIWTVPSDQKRIGPTPEKTSKILEAPAGWFSQHGFRVGNVIPLFNI